LFLSCDSMGSAGPRLHRSIAARVGFLWLADLPTAGACIGPHGCVGPRRSGRGEGLGDPQGVRSIPDDLGPQAGPAGDRRLRPASPGRERIRGARVSYGLRAACRRRPEGRRRAHADGATIEGCDHLHEGTPKIELGCKGILYVEMTSRTAKVDQHSSYAAIAPNPAWRLIHALMTLRDAKGRIKVPGWYKDARRPTARELRYLRASAFKADALKEFWGVSEFVGGGNDFEVLRRLIYSPTCTICGFVSGYIEQGTKTVNPAVAKAKIDFRLVPNMKQATQFEKLR